MAAGNLERRLGWRRIDDSRLLIEHFVHRRFDGSREIRLLAKSRAVGDRPKLDALSADNAEARTLAEESLALVREVGDQASTSEALTFLSWTLRLRGDDASAGPLAEGQAMTLEEAGEYALQERPSAGAVSG